MTKAMPLQHPEREQTRHTLARQSQGVKKQQRRSLERPHKLKPKPRKGPNEDSGGVTRGLRRGAQSAPSAQGEGGQLSRARSPAGSRSQRARPPSRAASLPGVGGSRADAPGSGAHRPNAAPPMATQGFPARPDFPQTRGAGRAAEGLGEESDTNPTSRPERDAGGTAIVSKLPAPKLASHRRRKRGGARAKEELRKGGAWAAEMLLNEETLFGARRRDKQRRARRRGDLPGTRAGTAEGDESSGIRKRAEAEASRDREDPGTWERKRSRRRGSRGPAITCSGRLALCPPAVLCACAVRALGGSPERRSWLREAGAAAAALRHLQPGHGSLRAGHVPRVCRRRG